MSELLEDLLDTRGRGVLATIRSNGLPQMSTLDFCYAPNARLARMSTTTSRAKVANLRRDPRASLFVPGDGMAEYVVAEGHVELSPVATHRDDAVVEELIEVYRGAAGEHPDWGEFRTAMVTDGRLVIRLHVERFYGWAR
jgi:PPOX class probable F420-dependent enzyme